MSTPNPPLPPEPLGGNPNAGGPSQLPPPQTTHQRRGCLLGGFLTCLTIVLIFAALGVAGLFKLARTGAGKSLIGSAYSMSDCLSQMANTQAAVLRYHQHTGSYPSALSQLAPSYINAAQMHCQLDKSADPTHPSFAYRQPAAGTDETAAVPLMSFHWRVLIPLTSQQRQITDVEYIMLLNGTVQENQNQVIQTNGGAVISSKHIGVSTTLGPGSTGL